MTSKEIFILSFIAIVILFVTLAFIVVYVLFYKYKYYPKKYKEIYYKEIYKIVQNNDYRLINSFKFYIEENALATIDHIIFGEKYIYIVISWYYDGVISGNIEDKSSIFIDRNGKKYYTDNPYFYLNYIITRMCAVSGVDKRMVIGIVATNDSCENQIKATYNNFFVCNIKKLKKLIKEIENSDVGNLNEKELQEAILVLADINKRGKKK